MVGRLFIAGASGWLGRAVRSEGERRGWAVFGLGRSVSEPVDGLALNVDEIRETVVATAPSLVVNCIGSSVGDIAEMRRANVDVVHALLESTDKVGARLVHIGSAAEFGDPGTSDRLSEGYPLRPTSDYGRTKAESSTAVIEGTGDAVVARLFNVAGPSPPSLSFLADLVAKVGDSNGSVELQNAEMVRDWVSLDSVVQAIFALGALRHDARVVHVCSGRGISHGELAAALGRCLGRRLRIVSKQMPGVLAVVGDPSLLRAATDLHFDEDVDDLARCVLPRSTNTGNVE